MADLRLERPALTGPALLALLGLEILLIALHLAVGTAADVVDDDVWRFGAADPLWTLVKVGQVIWFHASRMVWPYPLSIYYPEPFASPWAQAEAAAAGLLIVGSVSSA